MNDDFVAQARIFARRYRPLATRLMQPDRASRAMAVEAVLSVLASERGRSVRSFNAAPDASRGGRVEFVIEDGCEPALAQRVWEAVAPDGWVGDPLRCFQGTDEATTEHPSSLAAAVTLGAARRALVTAEALSAEGFARLRPFGFEPPDRVCWVVAPRKALDSVERDNVWRNRSDDFWFDAVWLLRTSGRGVDDYQRVVSEVGTAIYAEIDQAQPPPSRGYASVCVGRLLEGVFWRAQSVARDAVVVPSRHVGGGRAIDFGRPLRALADPFEPLVKVYELGFGIVAARRGVNVLVAEAL